MNTSTKIAAAVVAIAVTLFIVLEVVVVVVVTEEEESHKFQPTACEIGKTEIPKIPEPPILGKIPKT